MNKSLERTFQKKLLIVASLLFLCFFVSAESKDIFPTYTWKPLKIGGGGWVVGMYIHPTEPNLRYIRTDVSGAYRWQADSLKWKQIVTSASMPEEYAYYGGYSGVSSLVGAPKDPNIAYMAFKGQIFKSINRGDSWTATNFGSLNVIMDANGEGRQEGERLAVDPNNSDVVYYGSTNNALWVTYNAGANWSQINSVPAGTAFHGVNTINFNKHSGISNTRTKDIYVTVDNDGVYKSSDSGSSWNRISDAGPGKRSYRDAEIGPDGTYFVACTNEEGSNGAIWKYNSGIWTDITPAGSLAYWDLAVDPTNGQRIVVIASGGATWTSLNQGSTWLSQGWFTLTSSTIEWLGKQVSYWLSVGNILFDPLVSGKLWFAEGFSVWWTNDLTLNHINWTEQSAGIEESCGNAVICPPGGKPVTAMWDLGVFYHSDPDSYNAQRAYNSGVVASWHLDWCPADPNFIAGVFQTNQTYQNVPRNSYSTDRGKTWQLFASQPTNLAYGCVAVSATSKDNIVRLPANNSLPYYTIDMGKTWIQSSVSGYTNTGYSQFYSPMKPLCADRVDASTFYFYHQNIGIFKSTDKGASWSKVCNGPVLNRYNMMMKTTPGISKDIWLAEGKQGTVVGGLWHSINGGTTWTSVAGLDQAFSFGFGKAQTTGGYPTIYAAGVANGETGVFRSTNCGATWDKIATYPLGIFDWIDDIDGDKDSFGKVYICFAGSGFAYGIQNNISTDNVQTVQQGKLIEFKNGILNFKNIDENSEIRIYTTEGKLIYRSNQRYNFSINLSDLNLPTGVLVVSLNSNNTRIIKKIINR